MAKDPLVLFSPKLPAWQKKLVREMRLPREGTWILSSGTQSVGEVKAICLSQEALRASARAVNAHLRATKKDHWLLTLPTYHVGGLGILIRAELTGSRVTRLDKWDARKFAGSEASLSSLVPTQVYDLVTQGLRPSKKMRAIVVGGAALDGALYLKARALGWPLLPSYGLTECASQVATASLSSLHNDEIPDLDILSHAKVDLREGRLFLKSKAMCSLIARQRSDGVFTLEDPRRDGWLPTEDLGAMVGGKLRVLGRRDDIVKVLGELVSLPQLEARARDFFGEESLAIVAVEGGRAGNRLVLVTDSKKALPSFDLKKFNVGQIGPERISQLCWVPQLPRGELGKIKKALLRELF